MHRVDPRRWSDGFGALVDRLGPLFSRFEPRRHAVGLMLGLLSGLDCKNCWTIAELRGAATPNELQHLLSQARRDADAARDLLWTYLLEVSADPGAVLAVDETGDLKGDQSVGVQRQYTGTAGRIENSQVVVFLTYAACRGHALLDRALYLPRCWIDQPDRCAAAGVPDDVRFAPKPALAAALLERAVTAGVPAAGSPPTRHTAPTPSSAGRSAAPGWATCCRSAPTSECRPRPAGVE